MAERLRLFKGATELAYQAEETKIILTNDHIINTAQASILADNDVGKASIIDFTKADGTTNVFSAKVVEKKRGLGSWQLEMFSNGYELNNLPISNVYPDYTPEGIIQDIIDNNTVNLTYASSNPSSGVTISGNYVAKGYAIDIIKDLLDRLGWQMRIDVNDNVYVEPKGNVDNGVVFTAGDNIELTSVEDDLQSIINHVRIVGGQKSSFTQYTNTGDNSTTEYVLDHKPVGTIKVMLDGVIQDPNPDDPDYTVDAENKKIIFTTAPGGSVSIVIDYEYFEKVVVEDQDDTSIATYGEVFQEFIIPSIITKTEARRIAGAILLERADPPPKVKGKQVGFNFNVQPGELVRVIDTIRSEPVDEMLVISKIEYTATGMTKYEFGPRDLMFVDWQRRVEDEIKKLQQQILNQETDTFVRTSKHNLKVSFSVASVRECNSPNNSLFASHTTLGWARASVNGSAFNRESDCSLNGNHGVWYGSSIAGSQYTTSGYRLSAGTFNGSDNYVEVDDDATLDLTNNCTLQVAVKVSTLPSAVEYVVSKFDGTDGYYVATTADNKVAFHYYASGVENSITSDTVLTTDTWYVFTFVKTGTSLTCYVNGVEDNTGTGSASTIGTNNSALHVGRYSSTYFSGELDELRIYNAGLGSTSVINLYNKIHVGSSQVLYLSFDNPYAGDRSTSRVTC